MFLKKFHIQGVSKKNLYSFLERAESYFPKPFLNSKLQPISMSFKKKISILNRIVKKLKASNIYKTAYSSQRCVKKHMFSTNFRRKKGDYLVHKFNIFRLETQN